MTDPDGVGTRPSRPERTPGERRLERPPSERYAEAAGDDFHDSAGESAGSPVRAVILAVAAGLVGAAAYAFLAGPMALGAGLLVVVVAIGRFVGLAALAGARGTLGPGAVGALAIGAALAAVVLGEMGTWLYAGSEGGVLGLVDYVVQVHGLLAPLGLALTAATAWWTVR